jgi:putative peptidoglycan lipid II flippase
MTALVRRRRERAEPGDADGVLRSEVPADGGAAAVKDTVTVSAWTAVSRLTGVLRVLLIAAVLGPTYLGNAFQLTNAIPNLIYYGFVGGSLFASLLVPVLVPLIGRSGQDIERVTGGFLGVALTLVAIAAPLALIVVPPILHATSQFADTEGSGDQARVAAWLLAMTISQVLGYAVVGVCSASMNAHRRFRLPAAAPAFENLGVITMLLLVAVVYGSDSGDGSTPTGELLLLGLGSTAAVAIHAAVQWFGAARCGIRVRPRMGWRDPQVRPILRRAVPAIAQSALHAVQVLSLLVVTSTVAGGTVVTQVALNFYALPIALASTPISVAVLPRLARLASDSSAQDFSNALARGVRLVIFLAAPAATGYLVLSDPIAHAVAGGRMATPEATALLSWALASVALGLVGETLFQVMSQAAFAARDTRTPMRSMAVQCAITVAGCALALGADGRDVVVLAGLSYSLANLIGAVHLSWALRRLLSGASEPIAGPAARVALGCAALAPAAWIVARLGDEALGGRAGTVAAILLGCAAGLAVFWATQAAWRSQEAAWITQSLTGARASQRLTAAPR